MMASKISTCQTMALKQADSIDLKFIFHPNLVLDSKITKWEEQGNSHHSKRNISQSIYSLKVNFGFCEIFKSTVS